MTKKFFSDRIIGWYKENHRVLPWRDTKNPYYIWLSEIILQQTRVAQGLPYYNAFVKSFPTVNHLAKASLEQVLHHWQGLGYYSRARNLHKCAKIVAEDFNGSFPNSYNELIKLPGIGPYTAAAIASIAFQEPVAVVDGNVFRVLSRIFEIEEDIASPQGKILFTKKANELIDAQQPDFFNQALMEFGALHCLPKNPGCDECIFSKQCGANQKGLQKILPVKSKKLKVKSRFFYYIILKTKGKILMKQRSEKDIWHGLYDFYLIETSKAVRSKKIIALDPLFKNSEIISETKKVTHLLSHQKLHIKFIEVSLPGVKEFVLKKAGLKLFAQTRINSLPKPIIIQRYLNGAI